MKDFSVFLDMGRYKNWAHKNQLLKLSNSLKSCPASFSPTHRALFLRSTSTSAVHLDLISGSVENQQLQQHMI